MQLPPSFSGVVRAAGGETWCGGFADRAHGIPNMPETQFPIASGSKSFTRIVAEATLSPDLRARELLGDDLPLIDDRVTVRQLIDHTSGIGDYYDEDLYSEPDGFVTPLVHELDTTEAYSPCSRSGRPGRRSTTSSTSTCAGDRLSRERPDERVPPAGPRQR